LPQLSEHCRNLVWWAQTTCAPVIAPVLVIAAGALTWYFVSFEAEHQLVTPSRRRMGMRCLRHGRNAGQQDAEALGHRRVGKNGIA
jgi:hypothetical protein